MADWMRSAGMLTSRAFCTASRRRKLPSMSPPPSRAARVISRLARVNAWPRLASTMAFLCLMPAHLECPDTYALHSITNMLSAILPNPDPHDVSRARLEHVRVHEDATEADLLAVDPDSILLHDAAGGAAA